MIYTVEITDQKEVWKNQRGQYHREDGPAIIYADGTECWYRNGQYHREDGPAIIYADGEECWFRKGQFHREDGPAVIHPDGTKEWYRKGQCHREDGPAVTHADGTKKWYRDGQLHREDGPAIIYADGTKKWYLHGEKLSEEEFRITLARETKMNIRKEENMKNAAYCSLGAGVSVITDWHPDGLPRFTSWVEINNQPLRMPQGGVLTYANRQEAMFAGRQLVRRLETDVCS